MMRIIGFIGFIGFLFITSVLSEKNNNNIMIAGYPQHIDMLYVNKINIPLDLLDLKKNDVDSTFLDNYGNLLWHKLPEIWDMHKGKQQLVQQPETEEVTISIEGKNHTVYIHDAIWGVMDDNGQFKKSKNVTKDLASYIREHSKLPKYTYLIKTIPDLAYGIPKVLKLRYSINDMTYIELFGDTDELILPDPFSRTFYYVVQFRDAQNPSPVCSGDDDNYNGVLDWVFRSRFYAEVVYNKVMNISGGRHLTALIKRANRTAAEFDYPLAVSHRGSYNTYKDDFAKQITYKEQYYNQTPSIIDDELYVVQVRAMHVPPDFVCIANDTYNGVLDWKYYSYDEAQSAYNQVKSAAGGIHATALIRRTQRTEEEFDAPVETSHGMVNYKAWMELYKRQILYKEKYYIWC
jgi:hypothetical protein